MTNPAPVEPFNGKPADSLQGTDISPAQAYKMTNLDDILRRIAYWNGYDTAGEWERTGHEVKAQVEDYIATQTKEARIKELKLWQSYWKNGKDTRNTDSYVSDRIKELGE